MKYLITIIIIIFSMSVIPQSVHALFLFDKEVNIKKPGGGQQVIMVNNFSDKVVSYKTQGGWDDSNRAYIQTLQRLYLLQKNRGVTQPGYHYYNK